MNKLILIDGQPNQGKSYLANEVLAKDHQYEVIGTDGLYFAFIRDHQPGLFFPLLGNLIGPHYDCLVEPCSPAEHRWTFDGANVAALWAEHLLQTIQQAIAAQPRVAIEGYLLKCLDRNPLCRNSTYTLTEITARNRRYYLPDGKEIEPEQFA